MAEIKATLAKLCCPLRKRSDSKNLSNPKNDSTEKVSTGEPESVEVLGDDLRALCDASKASFLSSISTTTNKKEH